MIQYNFKMNNEINRLPKPSNLKRIYKIIGKIFLRLLDGTSSKYMFFYNKYITTLGVEVKGKPLYISSDLNLDGSDYKKIIIGNGVVISSEVRLLIHDYSVNKVIRTKVNSNSEVRKISKIIIEDHAFIGLRATILPGVKIGENAIVGACSVVTKDVPSNTVVAGNPAKFICTIEEYSLKIQSDIVLNHDNYFIE